MRDEKLKAVRVYNGHYGFEYYEIGLGGVTELRWHVINGHMAALDTVQVWKGDALQSEHPFCNCLGVYFAEPAGDT